MDPKNTKPDTFKAPNKPDTEDVREVPADGAVIEVSIEGDPAEYVARTPHVPNLIGRSAKKESVAVSDLIGQVQNYRRLFEDKGEPVPWVTVDKVKPNPDKSIRVLSGLKPPKITPPPRN